MAKRFFTVLILPDAASPARKIHIPRWALTTISSLGAISLFAMAFFVYQHVALNVRMLEMKQLRQDVGDRTALAERVHHLEGELSRLRTLDRKLRVVAGLDEAETGQSALAQGGSENLSRDALLDALRSRTGRLADWVHRDLDILGQEITSRERSFRELKQFLEEKRSLLASTPTVPPVRGLLTAGYGYRASPFTGQREMHEGLDIAAPHGTPIVATADGIVSFVGPLSAYGNVVFINHGHGFATFYAHNSRNLVREGQQVKRGQTIAHVGTTGRTTGPHVHYEVQINGSAVNPLKYMIDTSWMRYALDGESKPQS